MVENIKAAMKSQMFQIHEPADATYEEMIRQDHKMSNLDGFERFWVELMSW